MMRAISSAKTFWFGGILSLALLAVGAAPAVLASATAQKPNILLILADDLNNWVTPMAGKLGSRIGVEISKLWFLFRRVRFRSCFTG